MSIYLTGGSGFVGKNLISYFKNKIKIKHHVRDEEVCISQKIVIHLAGKAHDLKNISNKEEYYEVNTELTKKIFDAFIISDSKVFIMLSSVKAVADDVNGVLTEDFEPNPKTHYGKSKLLAERYILSKKLPVNKRVYILRPCMIHGPNNKGNLNLLYKIVSKKIPWVLGSFKNMRSYCSIDNLLFVIDEFIHNNAIPSGIYNIADDEHLSTNEIVSLMAKTNSKKINIFNVYKIIIKIIAKIGDVFPLPLNSERLKKLTQSYIVSNEKLKKSIGKELPVTTRDGIINTFKTFKKNDKRNNN
jgi:nucleoside-diphosphate-sugar epimerase